MPPLITHRIIPQRPLATRPAGLTPPSAQFVLLEEPSGYGCGDLADGQPRPTTPWHPPPLSHAEPAVEKICI
jgi:hypothetical protein